MNLKRKFLLLTLTATSVVVAWGGVAGKAADLYHQSWEEAGNRSTPKKPLPLGAHPVGLEQQRESDAHVGRGIVLFNGKGFCFGCHGRNGDIKKVDDPEVLGMNPRPADLREPAEKSVRQLYLSIKYGLHGTSMFPVQKIAGLQDEELLDILSYVLVLQRTPHSWGEMLHQLQRRDGEVEQAILAACDQRATGDYVAFTECEDRFIKQYRDLLMGRPVDIPQDRYFKIQSSCKKRFGTDLDGLAQCYGLEYELTRQTRR